MLRNQVRGMMMRASTVNISNEQQDPERRGTEYNSYEYPLLEKKRAMVSRNLNRLKEKVGKLSHSVSDAMAP